MNLRAQWSTERVTEDTIWIVDVGHDTGKSVTNDAENVVRQVVNLYGNKKIMYCDSDGSWDQLVHDSGEFKAFRPGVPPRE